MIAIFPELANAAAEGDLDKLADLVRTYFVSPENENGILNVAELVKAIGIQIYTGHAAKHPAIVAKDSRGTFTIGIILDSQDRTDDEQRFLLAHLLGHFFLHIQPIIARGEWNAGGFREMESPLRRYLQASENIHTPEAEREKEASADRFASALLIPKQQLDLALQKKLNLATFAKQVGMSPACLRRRMTDLGMAHEQPASFFDAERRIQPKARPSKPESVRPTPSLQKPVGSQAMPKGLVAQSYRAGKPKEEPKKADAAQEALERIRALARKIDKTIDK